MLKKKCEDPNHKGKDSGNEKFKPQAHHLHEDEMWLPGSDTMLTIDSKTMRE
jgi:hypothetical protein